MQASPIKIAITSIKPHAGRTTTALALAWALGRAGYKVVLLDLNQYRDLLPGKSETGSGKLWENVSIGSRETGEPKDADVVLVDTPPLSGKNGDKILRLVDAAMISVFPIAQNQRFLPAAMASLEKIDPKLVLGWFMARINTDNSFHRELAQKLRKDFVAYPMRTWIPEDNKISQWNALAGQEPPEGKLRDAYVELAGTISAFVQEKKKERAAEAKAAKSAPRPAPEPAQEAAPEPAPPAKKPTRAKLPKEQPAPAESSETSEQEVEKEPKKTLSIARERRRTNLERRKTRSGKGRRKLDSIPQPFPSKAVQGSKTGTALPAFVPRQGGWRLIGEVPKFRVVLTPAEGRVELSPHMRTVPDQVPASALRALLRFGLIHSISSESELSEPGACDLIPQGEPKISKGDDSKTALRGACGLLLGGQEDLAIEAFEEIEDSSDAAYLCGLLSLALKRPEDAPAHLARALSGGSQLGSELASLGLGVLVNVELSHGIATHFGSNQRGAHLAHALAHMQLNDPQAALSELDRLIELEPDDMLVHALRAERILDLGSYTDLEDLHRQWIEPSYETPIHVALAFFRAQALHRLGLPETASLDLRLVHAHVPEEWSSLQKAIETECEAAVETLARIQRVRNDLQTAKEKATGDG